MALVNVTRGEAALYATTGSAAALAIVASVHLMVRHLAHWHDATAQLSVVRIVMMVPVYALASWLALVFAPFAIYFDLVRDAYEALVLYEFLRLLLCTFEREAPHYFGVHEADLAAGDYLREYEATPWPFPLCWLPWLEPDQRFLNLVRGCVLQYVFLKPVLSFVAVLLSIRGHYHAGQFHARDGYLWIQVLCNVSITVALYALVVFYALIHRVVAPRGLLWKFLSIKILIFFIFWQSLCIALLYFFEVAPLFDGWSVERSQGALQDAIVCCEMPALAIAHLWIYSDAQYRPELFVLGEEEVPTLRLTRDVV